MVGPFVFVHPSEEHVEQIDEGFFLHGEGLLVFIEFPHHFVADVDDVSRLLRFPEVLLVSLLDKEADVIEEADDDLLFLPHTAEDTQEMAPHVLASLVPSTRLVFLVVADVFTLENFLQLLHAVVGVDGCILFIDLIRMGLTAASKRGLPRALSVLGLMRGPGACIGKRVLFLRVFV